MAEGARARALALAGAALAAAVAACTGDRFPEAFDGSSVELVYLADAAHATDAPELLAAQDLAGWIAAMTGSAPPPVRALSPELGLAALSGDHHRVVIVIGRGALADAVVGAATPLAPEAWRIERLDQGQGERTVVAATGGSSLACQYAAYTLAEQMGLRFLHPERDFVPRRAQVPLAWPLSLRGQPAFAVRGVSMRTERPLELEGGFLDNLPEDLPAAQHVIDWLVKLQQNQLEWRLLDSVPISAMLARAGQLVAYAHRRGLRAGVVVSLVPGSEHELALVHPDQPDPTGQLASGLDQLLAGAPWDTVHVTVDAADLGALPAAPPPDAQARAWLAAIAQHLAGRASLLVSGDSVVAAGTPLDLTVRELPLGAPPGSPLADPAVTLGVGASVFDGLAGRAARYGAPDPALAADRIDRGLGERQVVYLAEATSGPAELEVPLLLPSTVVARARDAAALADRAARSPRLMGQLTLVTGDEWGAWLSAYAAAALAVRPSATSRELFGDVAGIFGTGGPRIADTLEAVARRLDAAIAAGLLGYLAGDDDLAGGRVRSLAGLGGSPADGSLTAPGSFVAGPDWPHAGSQAPLLAGPVGQASPSPVGDDRADARIPFARIARMPEDQLAALERGDLAALETLANDLDGLAGQLADTGTGAVPDQAAPLLAELVNGVTIDALRARHSLDLYREAIEARRVHLTSDSVAAGAHRTAAQSDGRLAIAVRMQALAVVARQETRYRYPLDRSIAGFDPTQPASNPTVYPFGLMARVHLLSDWSRRELLAGDAQGPIDDRLMRITVSQVGAAESVTADAAVLDSAGWRGASVAFGDDAPAQPLPAGSPYLVHQFARTGAYDVTLTATDVTGGVRVLTVPVAVIAAALAVRPGALTVAQPPAGPLHDALAQAIAPLTFGVEDPGPALCRLALGADDDGDGSPDPGRLVNLPAGVLAGAHCAITAARAPLLIAASTAGDALPARDLALDADLQVAAGATLPSGLDAGRLRMTLARADLAALLVHQAGLDLASADAAVAAAYPAGDWLPIELDFTATAVPLR